MVDLTRVLHPVISQQNKFQELFAQIYNRGDLSNEEINRWLDNRITQGLLYFINYQIYTSIAEWMHGVKTVESIEGTAQLNAEAIGRQSAFNDILSIIASLKENNNDENQNEREEEL